MAKRLYHQHCGMAVALDLLGERWALLIIRDLMPGPRRFTDLFDKLSGISTDLLTTRLRSLERAGVIRQRQLDRPAPAKVYELTTRGEQLRPIVGALAQWGQELLPPPLSEGYRISPRWALASMTVGYSGGLPDGPYQLTIDDETLTVAVDGGDARLHYGPALTPPVLTLSCSMKTFFALARGNARPTSRPPADLVIDGDSSLASDLFTHLVKLTIP